MEREKREYRLSSDSMIQSEGEIMVSRLNQYNNFNLKNQNDNTT